MNEDYNDIDKIFQETFSKGQGEEDFSLPSDHMFENAMEVINDKEDDRNRRLLLFLILGVTLLLSVLGVYTVTEIDDLKSQQHQIAADSDNAINEGTSTSDQALNSATTSRKSFIRTTNEPSSTSFLNNPTQSDITASSITSEKAAAVKRPNQIIPQEITKSNSTIDALVSNIHVAPEKQIENITHPLQIISPSYILNYQKHDLITQGWTQPETTTTKRREVYVSTRSQWTKFNMGDIQIQDAELTKYDQNYQGLSLGIGIHQEINKRWSLQLEVGYNSIRNESKYTKDILYDKSKEITDPLNGRSYSADIISFSPLIKDQFSLTGSVDHVQMNDKDMVTQKSRIKNDLQYTYTRAIPMYSLINTEKWKWRLGAGAQFNFLINSCELNTTSLYKGNSMIIEGSHENTDKEMLSKVQVNFIATQEISYQLNQRIRLGFSGEFTTGLNTLNKENKNSPGRTFAQGWSAGINLYYNL